jgi:dihydrofolate reductase
MRKLIVAAFVSLDGVMQAPGGPEEDPTGDFGYGGWTATYSDDAINEAIGSGMAKPFELLLGRKTFEIFAAHWPYVETDPAGKGYNEGEAGIATLFNSVTKHVATRSPGRKLDWQNSRSLGSDVPAAVRELKKGDGPDLFVWGSSDLIQTLLAEDLVDEFQLLIYPLTLGTGKRLFGEGTIPAAFKVTKSTVSPSGVVIATYQRAGAVKTGDFQLKDPSPAEIERRRKLK